MSYTTEPLHPKALAEALALVGASFTVLVAPGYGPEGIDEFMRFIEYGNIRTLLEKDELQMWCCYKDGQIVGVLAARGSHISLLFVDAAHHRRGVVRRLLGALRAGLAPDVALTVNASPYGLAAYRRLGFRESGGEQTKNGIRFIPMRRAPDGEMP